MTNTAKLDAAIKDSGLMRKHIAKQIGVAPYSLALKIRGEREFRGSEICKLQEILGLSNKARDEIFFA